jgi:hypothetical protein
MHRTSREPRQRLGDHRRAGIAGGDRWRRGRAGLEIIDLTIELVSALGSRAGLPQLHGPSARTQVIAIDLPAPIGPVLSASCCPLRHRQCGVELEHRSNLCHGLSLAPEAIQTIGEAFGAIDHGHAAGNCIPDIRGRPSRGR